MRSLCAAEPGQPARRAGTVTSWSSSLLSTWRLQWTQRPSTCSLSTWWQHALMSSWKEKRLNELQLCYRHCTCPFAHHSCKFLKSENIYAAKNNHLVVSFAYIPPALHFTAGYVTQQLCHNFVYSQWVFRKYPYPLVLMLQPQIWVDFIAFYVIKQHNVSLIRETAMNSGCFDWAAEIYCWSSKIFWQDKSSSPQIWLLLKVARWRPLWKSDN